MSVLDDQERRVYDPEGPDNGNLRAEERRAIRPDGGPDGDGGFYRHGGGQEPDEADDHTDERDSLAHDPDRASKESRKARDAREGFYKAHAEHEAEKEKGLHRLDKLTGKKLLVLGSLGGGVLVILVLALFLFSILGSLKTIHFATVLRSAGLARFTLQMQKQYSQTLFDAATLTSDSTGRASKELGDRSMLQKMLRINPQKRLLELGQEGFLKFEFNGDKKWGGLTKTNEFKGVVIDGKPVRLDDLAQEKYKKDYKDLSRGETRAINAQFRDTVRAGLSDRLSLEGKMYRSSVYKGVRDLAGIRMIKWPQKDKQEAGKTDAQALEDEVQQNKDYVDNGNEEPKSGIKEIQDEADQLSKDAEDAAKKGKSIDSVSPRAAQIAGGAKKASTAAFVATGVCIVHDLNNSFQQAGQQTEIKAWRLAHDTQTTRDQIAQSDTNARVVGLEASRWDDADKSALYKQQTGVGGYSQADAIQLSNVPNINGPASTIKTLVAITDGIIKSSNPILSIPIVGSKAEDVSCDVILNQYTQWGIAGGELLAAIVSAGQAESFLQGARIAISGGVQLGAGIGLSDLLGKWIDKTVHTYAGLDYSGLDNHEKLYNESYVGTDDLQQFGTRQINFGRPIDNNEASKEQQAAMTQIVTMNKQKSFTQRYFAIDNPNSLLGNVVASVPTSGTGASSYAQRGLAFIGSVFSSPQLLLQRLGGIFLPHTMAATNQMNTGGDFGVDEWGTPDSDNAKRNTPAFSNEANTTYVEGQGPDNYNQLMDKYKPCYTYELPKDKPSQCTAAFLSTDEALHWRFYMAEICAASSLGSPAIVDAGQTGDLISNCTEAPTSNTPSSPTGVADATIDMAHLYDPSDNIQCAPGTKDLGVMSGDNAGEHNGKKVPIRLCEIPGFKCSCAGAMTQYTNGQLKSEGNVAVNSRVSGAWLTLFQTAKSQGVTMQSHSAFRTHAYQASLFAKNPDPARVARPGYSNHQMGLALDLSKSDGVTPINYGDTWHNWMKAHAQDYGFKQYPPESWHWSPTGN